MTGEPLRPECAEVQQRLTDRDAGADVLDHLVGCPRCSAFAAALAELDSRMAQLPRPEPRVGAADRAIARFRAEFAGSGWPGAPQVTPPPPPLGTVPFTPQPAPPSPPLTPVPSPWSGSTPPSQPTPTSPPVAGPARRSRRYRPAGMAAGLAAAIALVVALVAVIGPGTTSPVYAAVLQKAAVRTTTEKSAQLDITGAVGLTIRGRNYTAGVTGSGATVFPNEGKLTVVSSLLGQTYRQDTVSVGGRVWTRTQGRHWVLSRNRPDRANPIEQALAYPAKALDELTRVGSNYHNLGTTTVDGTRVRQIQVTIPADSLHAFGNLPQRVKDWTVVVSVSQTNLILRRLTILGDGTVHVKGMQVPFTYLLELTLHDFGARVNLQPPPGR